MGKIRKAAQAGMQRIKTVFRYLLVALSAVSTAVVLSVLFSITAVSDTADETEKKGFALSLKPAYLFSVPQKGDFVLYEGKAGISGGKSYETGIYDGEKITMEQVRGKVIVVFSGPFG